MFEIAFERWLLRWTRPIRPIYHRELRRDGASRWLPWKWAGCAAPLALLALLLVFGPLSIVALMIVSLPLLGWVWRAQMALGASAVIVREVENDTWDLLRVLPWPTARIVSSKFAGALMRMRRLFGPYLLLRAFATLGMLGFVGTTLWFDWTMLPQATRPDPLGMALTMAVCAAYMLLEPTLDLATDGALGVAASVFSRQQGQAVVLALTLSVAVLLAQLVATAAILGAAAQLAPGSGSPLQMQGDAITTLWWVALWGAGGALLFNVSSAGSLALLAALVMVRVAVVHGIVALAAWRAEASGP